METKKRAHLLDYARGALIIYMLFYHFLFDLVEFYSINLTFFYSQWFQSTRVAVVMALLFISGMVSASSRSVFKRAVKLTLCAALITAASLAILPESPIYFGIIHLFAACTLIYLAIGRFIRPNIPWIGAMLCLCAFMITYHLQESYLYFGSFIVVLPKYLYQIPMLAPLGFPTADFVSADYYPLLPWVFIYLSGTFYANHMKDGKLPDYYYEPTKIKLLEVFGRNTLLIYMVHQPLILGLLWVVFRIFSI